MVYSFGARWSRNLEKSILETVNSPKLILLLILFLPDRQEFERFRVLKQEFRPKAKEIFLLFVKKCKVDVYFLIQPISMLLNFI